MGDDELLKVLDCNNKDDYQSSLVKCEHKDSQRRCKMILKWLIFTAYFAINKGMNCFIYQSLKDKQTESHAAYHKLTLISITSLYFPKCVFCKYFISSLL